MDPKKYKVTMLESERGWGQRVDEVREFKTEVAAKKFVTDYNRKHNPPGPVPDWYIKAIYQGIE
jgi:hypothetical protein